MSKNLVDVKVEIVMPNYNSAPYLEETINSIIKQTFKDWKLTIVDANSNIETQKILHKYSTHENINIVWLKKNKIVVKIKINDNIKRVLSPEFFTERIMRTPTSNDNLCI